MSRIDLDLPRPDYPRTTREPVADDYHGTSVPDPYRWLEQATAERTLAWSAAQSALTESVLGAGALRDRLRPRLEAQFGFPRYKSPLKRGGRYFFTRNDGLRNQAVLYAREGWDGEPWVVVDPNALSPDGTTALTSMGVSHDGAWLAYGLSERGSDWQTIRIRDVATGEDLPEVLRWSRFAALAWTRDGAGFYYNRYPEPESLLETDTSRNSQVYYHRLGTEQAADELIYARPDMPELSFYPMVTDDGRYLVLHAANGTDAENRVYYRAIGGGGEAGGDVVRLLDDADAAYSFAGNLGSIFYFRTDLAAPRGRLIAIDVAQPERPAWQEVIGEQPWTMQMTGMFGGKLLVAGLHDARHRLWAYDVEGCLEREIPLPGTGTILGLSGQPDDGEVSIGFTSFVAPVSVYRYDLGSAEMEPWCTSDLDFDPDAYVTQQVFAPSRDGTPVPIFVTHRRDAAIDGDRPVLLAGYGGFNASSTPMFSALGMAWMDLGGVYAMANMRGGGEYGSDWHQAGMLDRKQNVFDDFVAAAEALVDLGYTRPSRLAIFGGSNGGLLVAACMLQRPDLFGAVVCSRPVIDMLRYHRFTVGRFWVGEYGNAEDDADHFRFMHAYSPLHNVRDGVAYPPILVLTADTDDRVVPAHAFKFVATLQASQPGPSATLLRVEAGAGHGFGVPITKHIDEMTDVLAFLVRALGIDIGVGSEIEIDGDVDSARDRGEGQRGGGLQGSAIYDMAAAPAP